MQVTGHRRFNGVHRPFVQLLVAFAQAHGEDMVLSTIQLLRVALVTRLLLLLLITLARLLIKTSLITLKILRIGI